MCSLVLNADDKARVSKGSLWPVTRTSNERRNNLSQCIYGLGYQKVSVLGRWHMKRVLFLFRNGQEGERDYNIVNFNHAWSSPIFKGDLSSTFVMVNKNKLLCQVTLIAYQTCKLRIPFYCGTFVCFGVSIYVYLFHDFYTAKHIVKGKLLVNYRLD